MNSSATIKTEKASKYLQQLCKHFAHKVDVDYDEKKGFVTFPSGPCTIIATEEELSFFCESQENKGLQVMHSIIEQHLVKFAWREELTFLWEEGNPVSTQKDVNDG